MQPRTQRQKEILDFIMKFVKSNGFEPSYQKIADEFGLKSKGGVAKHIEALEKKGLINRKIENGSFHLEVLPQSNVENLMCEIEWIYSSKNPPKKIESELLYVPKVLLGYASPEKLRAVMVNDDGMSDEHILEDDIAIIEFKTFVRDREIVAVDLKNEGIIFRKYYRTGANIQLVSSNENYELIIVPANKIKVLGVFKCLLRPIS